MFTHTHTTKKVLIQREREKKMNEKMCVSFVLQCLYLVTTHKWDIYTYEYEKSVGNPLAHSTHAFTVYGHN